MIFMERSSFGVMRRGALRAFSHSVPSARCQPRTFVVEKLLVFDAPLRFAQGPTVSRAQSGESRRSATVGSAQIGAFQRKTLATIGRAAQARIT